MEGLGRLAGGVAHDMNNILSGIMGLALVLRDELGPGHPATADIADIVGACKRGQQLNRNLLGFARKGRVCKRSLSINELVRSASDMIQRSLARSMEIVHRLDPGVGQTESSGELIS